MCPLRLLNTCQDFVVRFKEDSLPVQLTALFVTPVPPYWFANTNHQRTENSEDVLHRFAKFCFHSYKREVFSDKGNFVVPALDVRAKVLSIYSTEM